MHNIPDHCTLLGIFLESYLFREIVTFELKSFTLCIAVSFNDSPTNHGIGDRHVTVVYSLNFGSRVFFWKIKWVYNYGDAIITNLRKRKKKAIITHELK